MASLWDFPTKPAPHEGTCRMFQADLFERFSRIHPATPFLAWIPVVAILVARSLLRHELPWWQCALALGVGILAWTLTEYGLHRWVFHWTEDTPAGRRIHFLLHGVHHDFPSDKDRLVMPLGLSVPLGCLFYCLFVAVGGATIGEPFFAGFVLGYLAYDGGHYAIHHLPLHSRIGRALKKHHMLHHHVDHDGGFGVSTPLWDLVFRTMPVPKRRNGGANKGHLALSRSA
jgi:sterol desaturase/sphingolipid hydroxylase (fatty acid hydroxylase superfamily)